MYKSLVVIAAVVCAVAAQADKYPAGVNPALCPNFPLCDNSLLAHYGAGGSPGAYNPAPYANSGAYNPAPYANSGAYNPAPYANSGAYNPAPYANSGAYNPAPAAGYPAGVDPASCPNYPYCGAAGHAAAVAPLPGYTSRQYPAGVDAGNCPNYPYC